MRVEYRDDDLRRLYFDPEFHLPRLGPDVTKAFRKKVGLVMRVADERDLRAFRSLNFEKLKGDRDGQYSIRLNDQWRLIVELEVDDEGRMIVIIEVVDYH